MKDLGKVTGQISTYVASLWKLTLFSEQYLLDEVNSNNSFFFGFPRTYCHTFNSRELCSFLSFLERLAVGCLSCQTGEASTANEHLTGALPPIILLTLPFHPVFVPSPLHNSNCRFQPSVALSWSLVQPLAMTCDIYNMAGGNQWSPLLLWELRVWGRRESL